VRHGGPRGLSPAARIVATLAIGAAGGAAFAWARLPLPWMLGAMLATTVASLAGAPLRLPHRLRSPMVAVIGVTLGSGFDRELAASVPRWWPSLVALLPYALVLGGATYLYLRRVEGLDPRTAFFSSAPGGLSEMILLGERSGGDVRTISLIHATRILLVVAVVPFAARALGDGAGAAAGVGPPGAGADAAALLALTATGAAGFWLGAKLRLPAWALLGPMLASALAHGAGLVEAAPPRALVAAAQVVIGASVGARFSGFPLAAVARAIRSGAVLTVLMLALTAGVAEAVAAVTGAPFLRLFLAYVPGGLAEMSLVALSLGVEPAFVALHHILRIALVVAAAAPLFRYTSGPGTTPPGPT
jgi:uncharacterized protein